MPEVIRILEFFMGKSALIFWGGWDGHTPDRSAEVARQMLARNGFDVQVENGTAVLGTANLAGFDLIVPMITMSEIEKPELAALTAAVRAGTGLAGAHGMMCDAFRKETEYQFMTGGQWVSHPGNIIDYTVDVTRPDDPVMAGIGSFPYRSEQYYMHVDPSNEVLATTTFTDEHFEGIGGVVMPVVWKRKYGKGKVFYSALGHVADEFDVPQMATIFERGMLWAAR
jgi:uncharacterized protein